MGPPWLSVLLAAQVPCLDNGIGGTTGRGDWPPPEVDPSTVQCKSVSEVLQAYFLCHANGTLNQGPSDVIYDKCHALYEENDCYRPNECIVDAVNYCKSKHITCTHRCRRLRRLRLRRRRTRRR